MRKRTLQIGLLLLLAGLCLAADQAKLEELKVRAQQEQHPRLYAEIVRHQVELADDLYTAGEVDRAEAVIKDIITFTGKCMDAARAFEKPRKLKDTELTLSRAGRRLEDVRRSLNFDDQPAVKVAVDAIEEARRELLKLMFEKPKKPNKPAPEATK